MHLQADPADTTFRSPVFAAYYAQRLREVRARIVHLCGQAWDVNSVWLLQRDLVRLLDQASSAEPQFDSVALLSLSEAVGAALAQPDAPDAESRSTLLALLGALETGQDDGRPAELEVRRSENDRIEVPPPGFWRRWADDAPPQSWSEEGVASVDADADLLGLAQIDLGAMLASAGGSGAKLEIVHERIAPHYAAVAGPERESFEPPDDFIEAVTDPEPSGDYDWNMAPVGPGSRPVAGRILGGDPCAAGARWRDARCTAPHPRCGAHAARPRTRPQSRRCQTRRNADFGSARHRRRRRGRIDAPHGLGGRNPHLSPDRERRTGDRAGPAPEVWAELGCWKTPRNWARYWAR